MSTDTEPIGRADGSAGSGPGARPALLDAIWEASDDALLSLDRRGIITDANRAAARIFGHARVSLVGLDVAALFPGHLAQVVADLLARVAAREPVVRFEIEAQRRDGMPVPVSVSISPVGESGRAPEGAVFVGRDITERQLAQATLAEVEARIRESEALAHVGSWLWDVRTGAVQWSDELHRIHGLDPRGFDGTLEAHLLCVHADDRARVLEAMQRSVARGRAFDAEYRVVRPDGEVRSAHSRASTTIGSARTVVGLRGTTQDVTALRASPPEALTRPTA